MAKIELKSVRKSFQALEVIHGVDLSIEDGAFTVFVGPSGCGKSTLLRMIAGLEEITSGEVHLDGVRCDHLLPSARGIAMVFQSYALYPHMSVRQNLEFGLENIKTPRDEMARRVEKAAGILQIEHLLKRKPNQLSGGQSQRVAIGRAIVKEPKAFLLDEPLSNLDAELRVKMRGELVALHERLGATMVYVTHDQVEAMTMADKIVVLREGVVEQVGSPIELYARPDNKFVAGFLGAPQMNMFDGRFTTNAGSELGLMLDGGIASLNVPGRNASVAVGAPCTIGIRPEHLVIASDGILSASVMSTEVLGAETIVHASLASGAAVTFSMRGISGLKPQDTVRLAMPEQFIHVFDAEGKVLSPSRDWRADYISRLN
jgi:multiple sugar transport system ATP-binding protein